MSLVTSVSVKGLAAAAVVRAVDEGDGVAQAIVEHVALDLETDVAVRVEAGRKGARDEADVGRGLQPLEPDRRLVLAGRHGEPGGEPPGHVGVLDDGATLAEVGRETEVVDPAERALDDRPRAGDLERVRQVGLVADHVPAVGVQHAAELHLVLAVRGLDGEAAFARLDLAGRLGGRRVRLFLDLEPPLENLDRLLLLLETLQQLLDRRLLRLRHRERGDHGGDQ